MTHLLLFAVLALTQPAPPSVDATAWLTGCWSTTQGTRTVREHWMPPAGGTMIGVSRTVSGDKTVEYEFLVIRQAARGLEYVAKPSGQAEAVFTSRHVGDGEVVFENPSHDFPTRIAYSRVNGGLLATVSGTVQGKPRAIEFRYTAADCGR